MPLAGQESYSLPAGGPQIRVLMKDGSCKELDLELFLTGVVAAEMPASFHAEALAAQAVAARTYVLSHSLPYGSPRHDNADVCTDFAHCQAYLGPEQLQKKWGANFAANYRAICQAVSSTAGQAVCYGDELVETPYCSTCGGRTQSARDVWGADKPYLQSVVCAWDSHSPRAASVLIMSLSEAAQALAVPAEAIPVMSASYTEGGAIAKLRVANQSLDGLELRQKLGLDSAACQWLIEGGQVVFSTRGFGHGVGLCQYGADGMAKAGYSADEILAHYYQGISLRTLY